MHELALAESVVKIAEQHADGRRVTKVELAVGALRQVVPEALAFGFEAVAVGTVAEGAVLEIDQVPARLACDACGAETERSGFPLACGRCGSLDVDVRSGEELLVLALELEGEPHSERRA
jgi:hydrogenase nickel incorporation protein HypA/HybF